MNSVLQVADGIVCRCLRITESEVRTAVETENATTVRDIVKATTAGSGCTVCHCRIRQIIADQRAKLAQAACAESLV